MITMSKIKYTKNGYTVQEEQRLLTGLVDYAQRGLELEKTGGEIGECAILATMPTLFERPNRKYVIVRNPYAANHLHFQLTGKGIEGYEDATKKERKTSSSNGGNGAEIDYISEADKAMRLYGHPYHAAKVLENQCARLEQEMPEQYADQIQRLTGRAWRVIDILKQRAKHTTYTYNSYRNGTEKCYYDFERELEKMGQPLSPIGSLTLSPDEQAEIDAAERAEQERLNKLFRVEYKNSKGERLEGWVKTSDWESASKNGKVEIRDAEGNQIVKRKRGVEIEKRKIYRVWDENEVE